MFTSGFALFGITAGDIQHLAGRPVPDHSASRTELLIIIQHQLVPQPHTTPGLRDHARPPAGHRT
jgi:hypothetical protein